MITGQADKLGHIDLLVLPSVTGERNFFVTITLSKRGDGTGKEERDFYLVDL